MQLPGFVYTALILGIVAFLQAISTGLQSLDELWAPVAVAGVAALLKAVEALRPVEPSTGTRSLEAPRGFWSRFLLG